MHTDLTAGIPITAFATMEESMAADQELAKELAEADHQLQVGDKVVCVNNEGPIDIKDGTTIRSGLCSEELTLGETYTISKVCGSGLLVEIKENPVRWRMIQRFQRQ